MLIGDQVVHAPRGSYDDGGYGVAGDYGLVPDPFGAGESPAAPVAPIGAPAPAAPPVLAAPQSSPPPPQSGTGLLIGTYVGDTVSLGGVSDFAPAPSGPQLIPASLVAEAAAGGSAAARGSAAAAPLGFELARWTFWILLLILAAIVLRIVMRKR